MVQWVYVLINRRDKWPASIKDWIQMKGMNLWLETWSSSGLLFFLVSHLFVILSSQRQGKTSKKNTQEAVYPILLRTEKPLKKGRVYIHTLYSFGEHRQALYSFIRTEERSCSKERTVCGEERAETGFPDRIRARMHIYIYAEPGIRLFVVEQ